MRREIEIEVEERENVQKDCKKSNMKQRNTWSALQPHRSKEIASSIYPISFPSNFGKIINIDRLLRCSIHA